MIKTVFFDLDDTLFDHQYSRRCGFLALKAMHHALAPAHIREMELFHEQLTWANFTKVLSKEISLADAITERICAVCSRFGHPLAPAEIQETVSQYDAAYRKNRRPVPGSRDLLDALKKHVQLGIITNGFCDLQKEKMEVLGISPLIDVIVISEEAGFRKPDTRIFRTALSRAGADPAKSLYVGDSWNVDILPAHRCGMRAIWLNRYSQPHSDPAVAREITSYSGLELGELLEWSDRPDGPNRGTRTLV